VGKGSNISIWDQNNKEIHYAWATINEAHRTVTAQRSFSQPGVYSIRPYAEWNLGFGPYRITVGPAPIPKGAANISRPTSVTGVASKSKSPRERVLDRQSQ